MASNTGSSRVLPGSEQQIAPPVRGAAAFLPLGAVALAALLWALSATAARSLFDAGVTPIELVEARAVLAAAGLCLVPGAWARPRHPRASMVVWLGVAIALVNATYYLAIARLAVAVAIVLQYTGPAVVVGWTSLVERKKPSREVLVALVLAFTGVVLVSEVLSGPLEDLNLPGIAFGLGAAVMFATYTLQSEKAQVVYGPLGALRRAFLVASAFWIVVQIPSGFPDALFERSNLAGVLFVGLGGTLAPFILYIWAVGRMRSERAVIAATLEPLFAGLVAWVWLDQVLSVLQIAGGALILAGVVVLQTRRSGVAQVPPG